MGIGAHQVDVGIITILESEFEAVYRRLPLEAGDRERSPGIQPVQLVLYSISEDYFAVREQLGLTVAG